MPSSRPTPRLTGRRRRSAQPVRLAEPRTGRAAGTDGGVPRTLRIILADDHPVVRSGVRLLLENSAGASVVAEAATPEELFAALGQVPADLVLTDFSMPGGGAADGLSMLGRLQRRWPETPVIVLTMDSDDDSIFAALRAGARGYLLKEADGLDVERAINGVARGEAVFGAGIAERVLTLFSQGRSTAVSPFPELTPRELEMLELIAGGLDNPTIARRLFLSEKTVRNRVSAILTKLHARSRAEMVALARDAGLGGPADQGR